MSKSVKEVKTMAKQSMDLLELVSNQAEDADLDFLREAMGVLAG